MGNNSCKLDIRWLMNNLSIVVLQLVVALVTWLSWGPGLVVAWLQGIFLKGQQVEFLSALLVE